MSELKLGSKIRDLRDRYGLTQQELADRVELTKGFISQLENDLTDPSLVTLIDIARCLGVSPAVFFEEESKEKVVYGKEDYITKTDDENGCSMRWLISDAQDCMMEPVRMELEVGGRTPLDKSHEGEEFGYVLQGSIVLELGKQELKVGKGESFYFVANKRHAIRNNSQTKAVILWISTPPSF